jgi:hypothetical protein
MKELKSIRRSLESNDKELAEKKKDLVQCAKTTWTIRGATSR